MRTLDVPTITNGGGLLLALVVIVLAIAVGVLIDAHRPKCWVCNGRTAVSPDRIVRLSDGRRRLLCRVCWWRYAS